MPKVETALKRLRTRIKEQSGSDLNIDEFDASVDPGSQVVNAANTLAFLGGTRLVLVEEVQAWLKADKEVVAAYLRSPAPDACLVLVAEKLPAGDLLRAAMREHGDVLEFMAPKERQLPGWLVEAAASRLQMSLGINEARLIVQRCGANQAILLRELEKLHTYAGNRAVTTDDIRLLTTPTIEANIFNLLDSLALNRGSETFAAAAELLASGEAPAGLFNRILRHFQNLSRVAAMRDEGMSQEAIRTELKMKPYPVRKLVEQSTALGTDGIARRLAALADTDARMKGMGALPDEMELQLCLGRVLGA
ncbi:MAG: DNA polymerase III subunit delta [Actinobacteria bacterium]|nr:DNA polymerase III subunit delta [Actinomycetota bacterium]